MNKTVEYKCQHSKNKLTFSLGTNGTNVLLDDMRIDYDNQKLFVLLLVQSINKLKELNYKYLYQYVPTTDWEILSENWDKVSYVDNNVMIIRTSLDNAPMAITKSVGIQFYEQNNN